MPHKSLVTGVNQHPYQSSHPAHTRLDLNIASRDNLSSFTQRVMSAKLLRLKQLQNQLSEAHLQLHELCTENRLLRALQKRQDLALDRYEGSQAQLPQLVRSHQEEVRVLRTKYKNLKLQYRSVTCTLKEREGELQNLKEQHAHLLKLSKDRCLGDRETLTKQVNELKLTVENQSNTIQILNRKVLLETKNLKFQLQQEMQRHKMTQSELQQAFIKVDQLQTQLDQAKERSILPPSMDRFSKTPLYVKLAGGLKSSRGIVMDRNPPQNLRFNNKKTSKSNVLHGSADNTDPSSVQQDSSPATYSEKTNEFSTSLDSSPEHTTNEIGARDSVLPSAMASDTYQFHRSIMQKSGTDFDIHYESSRENKITDSNDSIECLKNDVLEKEYENAVAMLTELSTKHKGNFVEDVSSSLASLDLTSAKHVAALANATFALKGERQFSSKTKFKQEDGSSPADQGLQLGENPLSTLKKNEPSSMSKDKRHLKASTIYGFPDFQNESALKSLDHNCPIENNLETSTLPSKLTDKLISKKEPAIQRQESSDAEALHKTSKTADEEMEASRKDALLKALKDIDDNSTRENYSDEGDSDLFKMPARAVIPQRMFSPLNSSNVGFGDNLLSRRSNQFK